jgi:TatD DNase family protein
VLLRLADTHAHLADPALLPTVSDVVAGAVSAGVGRVLAVGTDLSTSATCVELAARFPQVYAAVGLHPHEAARIGDAELAEIRRLAASPKVVAIGEIGLDYYRAHAPREAQRHAFAAQLDLAAELDLPVVVHNRDADDDVLRAISNVRRGPELAGRAGVLHCFGGSEALAAAARDVGFFVSVAGYLTSRRAEQLRVVAARLPMEWVLTETDSPYLAPEPHRGRTNTPAGVARVVEALASARDLPVSVVAEQTYANAARLFGWDASHRNETRDVARARLSPGEPRVPVAEWAARRRSDS